MKDSYCPEGAVRSGNKAARWGNLEMSVVGFSALMIKNMGWVSGDVSVLRNYICCVCEVRD